MFNKHVKNHEKIRSLSHKKGDLCLQGKRDPFAAGAGFAVQTYIGGGTWLAWAGHGQARPGRGQVLWGHSVGAPGSSNAETMHLLHKMTPKFEIFIGESNFLRLKIKIWMNFVVPGQAKREATARPRFVARGKTDAKVRPRAQNAPKS